MPQQVINAILDRALDRQDMVDRAIQGATPQLELLKRAARSLARAKDRETARAMWRQLFAQLVLASVAESMPDAIQLARTSLRAEVKAARALGSKGVRKLPALRQPDLMRRAAERKGMTGGEAPAK